MKKLMRNQQGFTLVEMLIALLIVSIAFSAVLYAVNETTRATLKLEEKMAATWVAEDIITRAQLGLLKANNGKQQSLNKVFHWRLDSQSSQDSSVRTIVVSILNQEQEPVLVMTGFVGG